MRDLPGGRVIQFENYAEPSVIDFRQRIEELLAILRAIDDAELLAALPECAIARTQHQTALTLLRMMERELTDLWRSAS